MKNFSALHKTIYIFLAIAIVHLFAILLKWDTLESFTKPLIITSLFLFYLLESKLLKQTINLKIFGALFFSLLGDVILLFQNSNPLFFIFGLVSFLIAHIFYIVYFISIIKKNGGFKLKIIPAILILSYAFLLVYILFPKLGDMKLPVLIYATVITAMLISVVHSFKNFSTEAANICVAGACIFILSDSILAINKFHTAFSSASFFTMLTYILAQFLLVLGVIKLTEKYNTVG